MSQQFRAETAKSTGGSRLLLAGFGLVAVVWLAWYMATARTATPQVLTIKRLPAGAVASSAGMPAALRYAFALRDGNCNSVLDMTDWMRRRISYVGSADTRPQAVKEEKDRLCAQLVERRIEANQLQAEGVEDAYVFAPGSTIEAVRNDRGSPALGAAVKERIWLKVTYPAISMALRDKNARPIHSLVAGVNISVDNTVLKAGIVGNLEIDESTIDTRWELPPGE